MRSGRSRTASTRVSAVPRGVLHARGDREGRHRHPAQYVPAPEAPTDEHRFAVITGRTLYHLHTRTKTGRSRPLNRAAPQPWVELSVGDARRLGIAEGDLTRMESPRGAVEVRRGSGRAVTGVVFVPFHYGYWDSGSPDGPDGPPRAANELTITEWDPVSKQPLLKVAAARAIKVANRAGPSAAPSTAASAPAARRRPGDHRRAGRGHHADHRYHPASQPARCRAHPWRAPPARAGKARRPVVIAGV
jgi:predicted molibdopterin-dependent oxidoreductase YjgC